MTWKSNTALPDRTLIGKVWRTFDGKVLATIDGYAGLAMDLPTYDHRTWGYIHLSDLKTGDRIQVDDVFTCLLPLSIVEVKFDEAEAYREKCREAGLYIECNDGKHFLTGQLDDTGRLVGIRRPQS